MADIEKINPTEIVSAELLGDLRQIIDSARSRVAATANYELTAMYWHIGDRINRDVLNNARAEYGKQIVSTLSTQLQQEYGTKGFEERTVRRMMQFAQLFPDFQIVSPLVSKLSWSHFLIVMPIKTSQESALRSISPNCHQRKFSFANCKNPLRLPKIYTPTDDRDTTVKRNRRTAECPVDSQGVSAPREFAGRT